MASKKKAVKAGAGAYAAGKAVRVTDPAERHRLLMKATR